MKSLSTKFFEVLERELTLEDFQSWLQSLDNKEDLKKDALWGTFYDFNYNSLSVGYEFSKLLGNFDTNQYAIFKFGNTLHQIMSDRNLFRIVRSCNDFDMRYHFPAFGAFGKFLNELDREPQAYFEVRQELAALAETILLQWNAFNSDAEKLAFIRGQIPIPSVPKSNRTAVYEQFYGKLWKIWKN